MSSTLNQAQLKEVQRLVEERVKPLEAALHRLQEQVRELQERSNASLARVASLERRSLPQVSEEEPSAEPLGHDWFDQADLSTDYH